MLQHVHVMIFVGFGFLKVFLKTHSWTSVGYNMLIGIYAIQLTILVVGFWRMWIEDGELKRIPLDLSALFVGDFGAAAVLITFGALAGKCSIYQMWILATLEVFFYGLNEAIGFGNLKVVDLGGCLFVHTFGAFFGLAASYFFSNKRAILDVKGRCEPSYESQTVAMIGTLFLFCYWPSFNAIFAN